MNLAFIAIAVIIIAASFITRSPSVKETEQEVVSEVKEEVLSEETEEPSQTTTPTQTAVPTTAPTQAPAPPATQAPQTGNHSGWIYPNSSIVSQGSSLVLNSTDSTDAITEWYRNKIESGGYNVRSSVKTSANDNVKNVINAANSSGSVNVEITKGPSDSSAKIVVDN